MYQSVRTVIHLIFLVTPTILGYFANRPKYNRSIKCDFLIFSYINILYAANAILKCVQFVC